jgi:hypothetical protein
MALAKLQHQYIDPLKASFLNVDGPLNVGGLTNISGNLNVGGLTNISGNLNVNGIFSVNGVPLTASASTLVGTTLASNVIFSSLTSVGNITSGTFPATNISAGILPSTIIAGAGTLTSSSQVGYMGIPQNTNPGSSYNIAATDNGKHIYITTNSTALTILANSNLALPIGFSFVIINAAGVTSTIACGDTLLLAGTGSTGTRTLSPYAMATLIKTTSTSWTISGNGIS